MRFIKAIFFPPPGSSRSRKIILPVMAVGVIIFAARGLSENGTPVDVFIFAFGCDFDFATPAQAGRPLQRAMGSSKVLVAVHERPWPYPGWLLSDVRYEILFERFDGFAISFHLDADGRLRFFADRCGATPEAVIREAAAPNLLGPTK